jgi:hypothetical protein
MTTSILINALGQALFESFGQALLIYVVLQLFMQFQLPGPHHYLLLVFSQLG